MDSKQRARLRASANGIETVLQIGKDGIGENLIRQADMTLEARELIKGRVLDGCIDYTARTAAEAYRTACERLFSCLSGEEERTLLSIIERLSVAVCLSPTDSARNGP